MINCKVLDRANLKSIVLEKYNPQWSMFFEKESQKIKLIMGKNAIGIYHVGSTSVPTLLAKPIIDIILVVKDLKSTRKFLTSKTLEYHYKGEYNLPLRDLYGKEDEFKIYLHVHLVDSPEIELNLSFRDYLRNNRKARKEYELVKIVASKNQDSTDKTKTGITKYNLLKNDFIVSVLRKSGFFGICARFATQEDELAFFYHIKNNFFKRFIEKYSLSEQNSKKIVLYEGVDLVGVTELIHNDSSKLLINFSWTIDNQKFLKKLLYITENWVRTRTGINLLQANVKDSQSQVYLESGFIRSTESMLFVKVL